MKIELNTGGRSAGKTMSLKQKYNITEEVKKEDLINNNPFIEKLAKKSVERLEYMAFRNTLAGKFFEKSQHQKKVIDRLSRKIQKLKRKKRHFDGAYIIATKYIERYYSVKRENDFLRERENKLQLIEQMFKNGVVDLSELDKLVRGGK